MGLAVVLESVGEQVDPLLDPVLLKQTFKVAGIKQIKFGEEVIDYADDFRLYMTSKLSNPHYLPDLTTKVTIINFMITNEILRDQLLNLVVKMEDEVLEEERVKLI
jgi:dynein heavy chain